MKNNRKKGFVAITFIGFFALISSCKPHVKVEDGQGNSIELEITDFDLTSSEKEAAKDSLIIRNINAFLQNNPSAIVQNYWFLCDSSNIEPVRDFYPKHKNENIDIHIGKKSVSIRPIPSSYKIQEGPFARYTITNDSLGNFHSYVIDVSLTSDYHVLDFNSTLRFSKDIEGVNRVSFKRLIQKDEHYLIEDKKEKNTW